jgi:hypothetical protein
MPQYLIPKAACKETGQTVLSNDLGKKFMIFERRDAQKEADRLAGQMSVKTGRTWSGFIETFTVEADGRNRL